MSTTSSTFKSKKKVVCYIPTSNRFENIKPIEVKCFPDEKETLVVEADRENVDGTATMVTVVPLRKRPMSVPSKRSNPTAITDATMTKPIRHLAVLPSSKERSAQAFPKHGINLSDTFTLYDGPTTTPAVGRSLNDTMTMNYQYQMSDVNEELPVDTELNNDETYLCNNTTVSSVCELLDQAKLQQKPHSLIGRYQLPQVDNTAKSSPAVHVATVYYGESQPSEPANKQHLIQQFYSQLENFKTTFNTESSEPLRQLTTNTLTFDNGQVRQTSATKHLKEKPPVARVSSATVRQADKKPVAPKKPKLTKTPSTRVQSAPIRMTTRPKTEVKRNSVTSCKQHRSEKVPNPSKKSVQTKEKQTRRVGSAPPNRIDIRGPEVTLLPQDEEECRHMYEKLQRLQPNGTCVDLNTLRRALYPPMGTTTFSANSNQDQISAFKYCRQRSDETRESWVKADERHVSKQSSKDQMNLQNPNLFLSSDNPNIDRIMDQMKKHAEINYSYYTRTK
ncbi:unnamed protein product [Adineta ricciae]|uniref:Uncharacterized protein n=1 Tax=Adineta ricciae TaxID=249248 RepID=A0A814BFB6_ADIRI|nr:unnamed protein product [Adineta ricciae]